MRHAQQPSFARSNRQYFWKQLSAGGRADAVTLPLPTQLGSSNVVVTACGRSIPLYSVFPGQINASFRSNVRHPEPRN